MDIRELKKQVTSTQEDKWRSAFDSQARYVGGGTYTMAGIYSSDIRDLFLKFVCQQEFGWTEDFGEEDEDEMY